MKFEEIFPPYERELKLVEEKLRDIFSGNAVIIRMIGEHIIRGGGKRLRPLFLLLSADLSHYKGEDRILFACILEAIHTASLIHDDVVDGAELRRGNTAAHLLWGNQLVILVGDYVYANAFRLAILQENQKVSEALINAMAAMTEGEILQLQRIGDPEITMDEYYKIIAAKTAALISAACRIGGILGGFDRQKEDALARFGMKAGIAFQMVDDILDYRAEERELGKRLGKDLKEGKITLPLIYLLKVASEEEKEEVRAIVKNSVSSDDDLGRVLRLFEKYRVIHESLFIAKGLVQEARSELALFQDSSEKEALLRMADYALTRDK
jgi:octaprenyl-diphosphate synthase